MCLGLALVFDNIFRNNISSSSSLSGYITGDTVGSVGATGCGSRIDQPIQLSGRTDQHGSWTGNVWIPPRGWKYYSANELRAFYQGRSILWIGDSTGKRTALTMYGILNSTNMTTGQHVPLEDIDHIRIINKNKGYTTEPCDQWTNSTPPLTICRPTPGNHPEKSGRFLIAHVNCLTSLETLIQEELSGFSNMTKNVDLIIISLGVWEAVRARDCRDSNRSVITVQTETIELLEKLQSKQQTTIIWRTSGYSSKHAQKTDFLSDLNEHAMDQIEELALHTKTKSNSISNLTFVDWGGAILPRSFGAEKIPGADLTVHYDSVSRQVLIQMLTNHVSSRSL